MNTKKESKEKSTGISGDCGHGDFNSPTQNVIDLVGTLLIINSSNCRKCGKIYYHFEKIPLQPTSNISVPGQQASFDLPK